MPYQIKVAHDKQFAVPADDWMFSGNTLETYEHYVIRPFLEAVRGRDTVLDVGSNIGLYSILAAPYARRVIALDASALNAKLVLVNAKLNGIFNVEAYPVAVSDRVGMATFGQANSTNKVMAQQEITIETIDSVDAVLSMPLDLVLPGIRVDVLKIDVEGREYAAMVGAQKILSQLPVVFSEYSHNFIKSGCGVDGAEYLNLFFSKGYTATVLYRDMTQEFVGGSADMVQERWQRYIEANITHLDLKFSPPGM